jgi:hypothetical protein
VLAVSVSASALTVELAGPNAGTSAKVTFTKNGDILEVHLENTSTNDVMNPLSLLQGVFFGVDGLSGALTTVSATLQDANEANAVIYPTAQEGIWTQGVSDLGGEWAYNDGVVGAPDGANHIIASTGLGLVGVDDRFGTINLAGPVAVDGMQYGMVNGDTYAAGGNSPVTGGNALITNDMMFELSGFDGFDLDDLFGVSFQWGTDFDGGQRIPAPGAAVLAGLGLGRVGFVRRRFSA